MPRYPYVKDLRLIEISNIIGGGETTSLSGTTKIINIIRREQMELSPPPVMDAWTYQFIYSNYPLMTLSQWGLITAKDKVLIWQRNIRLNLVYFVPNILGHISINELDNENVWSLSNSNEPEADNVFLLVAYF